MSILIIDNYDSFTFNLYQLLQEQTEQEVVVRRNDALDINAIRDLKPAKIVLSPGPGHPANDKDFGVCKQVINFASEIKAHILGICLGHQVAARALGAGTFKLPFGHRGGNHPVQDVTTGNVTITAQNHGYAVDPDGLNSAAYVSHINLNDQTVEGVAMRSEPLMTIQYHSEACPGPLDSEYIFDRFIGMMVNVRGGVR